MDISTPSPATIKTKPIDLFFAVISGIGIVVFVLIAATGIFLCQKHFGNKNNPPFNSMKSQSLHEIQQHSRFEVSIGNIEVGMAK